MELMRNFYSKLVFSRINLEDVLFKLNNICQRNIRLMLSDSSINFMVNGVTSEAIWSDVNVTHTCNEISNVCLVWGKQCHYDSGQNLDILVTFSEMRRHSIMKIKSIILSVLFT